MFRINCKIDFHICQVYTEAKIKLLYNQLTRREDHQLNIMSITSSRNHLRGAMVIYIQLPHCAHKFTPVVFKIREGIFVSSDLLDFHLISSEVDSLVGSRWSRGQRLGVNPLSG